MRSWSDLAVLALALFLLGLGPAPDPAARGLDLFVHVAKSAAAGSTIEVNVQAFGFPEVTRTTVLAGAEIEAGWDPETLAGSRPPPSVVVRADADGRARLVVPVPSETPEKADLLIGVRYGAHRRTRSVTIERAAPASVELHVADNRVVPRSTVSAWVRVVGIAGEPLPKEKVTVSLIEAGVARHTQHLVTDAGGLVLARVPIPSVDEPVWSWTLRAMAEISQAMPAQIELTPRDETPGKPTLTVAWEKPSVLAGDTVSFAARLLDATGQPVASHSVRTWTGPKGASPPKSEQDWEKVGTPATTDGVGVVRREQTAPTLVKASGTEIVVLAHAELEGHVLDHTANLPVGMPSPTIELVPEAGSLVPGLTQRLLLRVHDARGAGVAGTFEARGDGLFATITTDADGEGELTWTPPEGVGATRNVGPCAGGVAAAVVLAPKVAIESLRDTFTTCVSIDRDADGFVRAEPNVARPGDRVRLTVVKRSTDKRAASVVARPRAHAQSVTTWLTESGGDLVLPADAGAGTWDITIASSRRGRVLGSGLLVVPHLAPRLVARRIGGRATPGGMIEVEAELTDGAGHGVVGSVSAVVADAFGGGDLDVRELDTRTRLCGMVSVDPSRCDDVLSADPSTAPLRRALLGRAATTVHPTFDPVATSPAMLRASFADVVRSLEGAVFEATTNPNALGDVRRRQNGRWVMNPELLTLATDAMSEPPMTPGGEPLTLPDLVAVDPQVSFDLVARRVTRLKVFRVLSAVRDLRAKRSLDPDEPIFRDPNALLRRMVRDDTLTEGALLDPWGGTLQFVRSNGTPGTPFLAVVRGWELHAPGPDGVVGTGDDVSDPFERVLRSGTPYAEAVEEDQIVDAKWDMVVSEDTVRSWDALLTEHTGTSLGNAEGIGLGSVGSGGGGAGIRQGATSVRRSNAIATGDAYWTPPMRTDAEGRVKMTIPLGDVETTWRIALVGVPDGASPASTTLDVASDLPLSSRVNGGARWVEGDTVATEITVRNRGSAPVHATVTAKVEGHARIDAGANASVDVPAHGAARTTVLVRALRAGDAALVVTTRAPGAPDDVIRHQIEVLPPGEKRVFTQADWVEGHAELAITLDHGFRLDGAPRIVLERGFDDAVAGALDALEPERQPSSAALADAVEGAVRVERWATTKATPRHRALAFLAKSAATRAQARFAAYVVLDEATAPWQRPSWTNQERMRTFTGGPAPQARCPGTDGDALDVEPAPAPDVLPCWGAYVAEAERDLFATDSAPRLALAVLATADRPHRAALAARLADRLRSMVKLDRSGAITGAGLEDRAERATVYAALLRASKLGASSVRAETLFARLAVLRDATGSFGSSAANVAAIRALLASQLEGHGTSHVRIRAGAVERRVDVPETGEVAIALPPGALDVTLDSEGPGVVARFERPVLRLWSRPPPPERGGISVEVVWPAEARARSTGTLRVLLRSAFGDREVDAKIPLPPGAVLAAKVSGTTQLDGVLTVRQTATLDGSVIEVPIRFGFAGKTTIPEATARLTRTSTAPATAPARPLVVR